MTSTMIPALLSGTEIKPNWANAERILHTRMPHGKIPGEPTSNFQVITGYSKTSGPR